MESGTRSILDLFKVSDEDEYCTARLLSQDELIEYFGTTQPSQQVVDNCDDLFDELDRGKGLCIPIYDDGKAVELYFIGYSFD